MAESPSHRFGQVIGNLLEEILAPELIRFCDRPGLYLDRHGERINVRKGRKVSWEDRYGNSHDLDFVIERGGDADKRGRPVAFIEAAWRRYTKHSRAKAQEIQGAVLPIAETYEREMPFLGAVLAGHFTAPSIDQLRSLKFNIVHVPYETIVAAFAVVNIDVRFDETTPDADFRKCVDAIGSLHADHSAKVKEYILTASQDQFSDFFQKLGRKLDRMIEKIVILPLFGAPVDFRDPSMAADFISGFDPEIAVGAFRKYEVSVEFSNGDEVKGVFAGASEGLSGFPCAAGRLIIRPPWL